MLSSRIYLIIISMRTRGKKRHLYVVAGAMLFILMFLFPGRMGKEIVSLQELITPSEPTVIKSEPVAEKTTENIEPTIPPEKLLTVPFVLQAPFGIWDPLHEDACEEASILTIIHFFAKDKSVTKEKMESEIQELVAWEEEHSYGPSITLDDLGKIGQAFYKLSGYRVIPVSSTEDMKKEIAKGNPVIVPAAGKILPNPNFQNGGPNYHMLVVKGYTQTEFITNDPGTRKGEGFVYTYDGLFNAIHDWNSNNILNGEKAILVFEK